MKITRNSWHFQVYDWWYNEKYPFHYSRSGNLCPYIRAVLIWAPARFFFWVPRLWATLTAIFVALTYTNYKFHGKHGLSIELHELAIAGKTLFILGLAYGLLKVLEKLVAYLRKRRKLAPKPYKTPFLKVIANYLESVHDNICPHIEFVDSTKTSESESEVR